MLEQQESENKHQVELLRSSIASQEQERKRIAHDIHDEIGGLLTTSRRYFDELYPGQTEEELKNVSHKINLLFDEITTNIRRISHDLRPVILENMGFTAAIESMSEKLESAGLHFRFVHELALEMNHEAEMGLYRIIQELVGNTLKHANASTIVLSILQEPEKLVIEYQDDGIGFSNTEPKNGLGMKSIQSRLSLLNGSLEIKNPGKGIHFLMEIDLAHLRKNATD